MAACHRGTEGCDNARDWGLTWVSDIRHPLFPTRPLERPDPQSRTVGDMAQAGEGSNLDHPPNQGLFHNKERSFFRALCLEYWAWLGLLLSYFFGLCFSIKCSQILMTGSSLGAAIADLIFSIMIAIILGAQGMKSKLKSACHSGCHAILLLICSLGLMISGARAEPQNEADIQSCTYVDPSVLEILDYAKAAAVTILAGLTTIIARRMINRRLLVPAVPAAVPELQAIPAAVQGSLPVIPVVQGDDIDDVLARALIPSRLNSPLSWL